MVYGRGPTCGLEGAMGVSTLCTVYIPLSPPLLLWLHFEIDSSVVSSIQPAIFGGSFQLYYHRLCVESQRISTAGCCDTVSPILCLVDCHVPADSARDWLQASVADAKHSAGNFARRRFSDTL
jgi:hypothetical protein